MTLTSSGEQFLRRYGADESPEDAGHSFVARYQDRVKKNLGAVRVPGLCPPAGIITAGRTCGEEISLRVDNCPWWITTDGTNSRGQPVYCLNKSVEYSENYGALPRADKADICLLLEGDVSYVGGGVSSWVNSDYQYGFPRPRFALLFVGSAGGGAGNRGNYPAGTTWCRLEVTFICMTSSVGARRSLKGVTWRHTIGCAVFHRLMRSERHSHRREELLGKTLDGLGEGCYSKSPLLHSRASWVFISCLSPMTVIFRFVDTGPCASCMPLAVLHDIASNLIPARMYHALSTGYAGFSGAI
ncbi:DUF3492 domain-containing protein [Alcanivorax sp.]|uniref:DUF3492 domain-containing protein n=1 Tax=Alcanivorax sp. TaxID=1872427 RepID=UPI0025B809E9|nr:DUF3492 domain-containing protein [Alcanivorax sp.]